MNAYHATPRRPSKDHDVTWSRSFRDGLITWTLWRRDYRRAIHMHVVAVSEMDLQTCEPGWLKTKLRRAWHELRDFELESGEPAQELKTPEEIDRYRRHANVKLDAV